MPEDGPSARLVANAAKPSKAANYALIDVDYHVAQIIKDSPSAPLSTLTSAPSAGPSDLISAGDVLSVSVYQATLGPSTGDQGDHADSGGGQTFPRLVVDRFGLISVPFAGPVAVASLTPTAAAAAIRRALRGKLVDPQVVVSPVASPRNSVIVLGEVRSPGRIQLAANADRLMDALAGAGGTTKQARDLAVTVVRGDHSAKISLATLLDETGENIRLAPLDQVRVTLEARKINVFGAVGKTSEIAIEDDTITLAGALARIGGLNPAAANARSVLLFRFERPEAARALGLTVPDRPDLKGVPVVYRFNLRDPAGYFIATKFELAANDLVYVPTADVAELQKFLNLVNSFGTFLYDASVTKSLGL